MRQLHILILWSLIFFGLVSSYNNCGSKNTQTPVINMHSVNTVDYFACDFRAASGAGVIGSFCTEQQLTLTVTEASLNHGCATANPPGVFSATLCNLTNSVGTCVYGGGSNGETHKVFYSDGGTPWTTAAALTFCESSNGAFVP